MAKLTAAARKKIPTAKFAGPARSYPVHDRAHAANAKARATQALKKGNISATTSASIHRRANKVLKNF